MHGVQHVYPGPPDQDGTLDVPSVMIPTLGLPLVEFTSGQIRSIYTVTVNWLFSPNETASFPAALEALPMMIESLSTDLELATTCTGGLTVVGGTPAVGIFDWQNVQYIAAQVIVNAGFIDAAEVT